MSEGLSLSPLGTLKASLPAAVLAFVLALVCEVAALIFGYGRETHELIAEVVLLAVSLFVVFRFSELSLPEFDLTKRHGITFAALAVGILSLICIGKLFSVAVTSHPYILETLGKIPESSLYYGIPIATGAILVQAVLGLQWAMVFSIVVTILAGQILDFSAVLCLYILTVNLVGALSLNRVRSRSSFLRAGVYVSTFAIATAACAVLVLGIRSPTEILFIFSGAITSGLVCAVISAGLIPLLEYFGGYVTDIRLIEMATLDHPLLRELSIQAPGTWNHSMVMGSMAEAGAEAIGANAVLARVSAYFHDIGKSERPMYFVENQRGEENPHDRLSPSMSALIIRSHVKEGFELAEQHHLPAAISDMIVQHHGTNLIEYFYDRAVREARQLDENAEVDPTPYLYPGPKPQSREAGILMLADAIEAAARTLPDPDVDRIQGMVQKLVNKVFASGQLDESQLTLRDLHLIAKAFTRVLSGIHHKRIAYTEPAEKVGPIAKEIGSDTISLDEVDNDSAAQKSRDSLSGRVEEEGSESKRREGDPPEDLKRLGIN